MLRVGGRIDTTQAGGSVPPVNTAHDRFSRNCLQYCRQFSILNLHSGALGEVLTVVTGKQLTRSLEDYLEAILLLVRRGRVARVRDIAHRLEVGMPAVSAALKTLSARGLVNYDPYQVITLTDRGCELAEEVSRRHDILRRFLTEVLGLDAASAEANACRMEHAVDAPLLDRLERFNEFLRRCPRIGPAWTEQLESACWREADEHRCRRCSLDAMPSADKLRPQEHSHDE